MPGQVIPYNLNVMDLSLKVTSLLFCVALSPSVATADPILLGCKSAASATDCISLAKKYLQTIQCDLTGTPTATDCTSTSRGFKIQPDGTKVELGRTYFCTMPTSNCKRPASRGDRCFQGFDLTEDSTAGAELSNHTRTVCRRAPKVQTMLELHFKNAQGAPVQLSKAAILISGWGYTSGVLLKEASDTLTLPIPLTAQWFKDRGAIEKKEKPENSTLLNWDLRLLIQAPEYQTMISQSFVAPDTGGNPTLPINPEFETKRGSGPLDLNQKLIRRDVVIPKAANEIVRFEDSCKKPVPGVRVSTYILQSSANHNGLPVAIDLPFFPDPKLELTSDRSGTIRVPAGDLDRVIEIAATDKSGYILHASDTEDPTSQFVTVRGDVSSTTILLDRAGDNTGSCNSPHR